MAPSGPQRARVVGAGFSGLLAAYYLRRRGFDVEVLEAAPRGGGLIHTYQLPWGLMETGANGFLSNAEIESVAREINCDLVPARKQSRRRFIFRAGRARQWPLRFFETLGALARILLAWLFRYLPPQPGESMDMWGSRVGGRAFARWILAPAIQGIYAAPSWRLSARLLLGRFFSGPPSTRARPLRGRLRGLVAPRGGMGEFTRKLELFLIRNGVSVQHRRHVRAEELARFREDGPVVIATGIRAAGPLIRGLAPTLASALDGVGSVGIATVTSFFEPRAQDLRGFGCLFPRQEGVQALGVLFNTEIFADRGGLRSETWIFEDSEAPLEDSRLLDQLQKDRFRVTGSKAEPTGYRIQRWPTALPVYDFELERALERPEWAELESKGFYVVGNYRGSLGLSRLILSVKETMERVA